MPEANVGSLQLKPFPHLIVDGLFNSGIIKEASKSWPSNNPHWIVYDNPLESKRALNYWTAFPSSIWCLLRGMMDLPIVSLTGITEPLTSDPGLWGAGLHEMKSGDHLDLHLDCELHPRLNWQRRANMLLYLSEWQPEWGGELELWEPGAKNPAISIVPHAGRLVLFCSGKDSLHRVNTVKCPPDKRRQSIALYWWSRPSGPSDSRLRALFIPMPDEDDSAKDILRRKRAESGL